MKPFMLAMSVFVTMGTTALAFGNPSMLPKHPGYPSGGEFAYDTGQANLTHEQSARRGAASADMHVGQDLVNPDNARVRESTGAGQLPRVEGPQIKIEPPVKEGTRMR